MIQSLLLNWDYVLTYQFCIMHKGFFPTKAALAGGCTFVSTNYFWSCEADDLDMHEDDKNNPENAAWRIPLESWGLQTEGLLRYLCTGKGECLPLGNLLLPCLRWRPAGGQWRWVGCACPCFCSRSSPAPRSLGCEGTAFALPLPALTVLSCSLQKHRGKEVFLIPFHICCTFITEAYLVLNEKQE